MRGPLGGAAALGAGGDALAEAESSGLIRVEDHEVQMRHPLVWSAVYTATTSSFTRAPMTHQRLRQTSRGPVPERCAQGGRDCRWLLARHRE